MASLPPLKPEHHETLRSLTATLAASAVARIGFGLSERPEGREPAGTAGAPPILLASVSLRIEDSLLMAFGPEGDPIPPASFVALAAGQPDAEIALAGGGSAPALRVAAVLEAQAKGPLAGGEPAGGEAWIEAMLGLGPQPVLAAAAEVRGEDRVCELTVFGRELMLAIPGAQSFLIADAAAAQAATGVGLLVADGRRLSVGDLAERLRAAVRARPATTADAGAVHPFAEIVLPDCVLEQSEGGLLLMLPPVGAVRLTRLGPNAPAGPRVSIVLRGGEPADLADLTAALDRAETALDRAEVGPAGTGGTSSEPDAAAPEPDARTRALPVAFAVPRIEGVDPDRVAALIVRGLPPGGALSAGIDDGDGRWVLSPRQLVGLTLIPPAGWNEALSLQITAVAARNRAGEFVTATESVVVPLEAHAPAETVVPLAIDPTVAEDGKALSAVMIRGLPAGARLSAGTYDPATGGWVLRPDQLERLTVAVPIGQRGFALTVLGIALATGGRADARLLTRLAVPAR